MSHKRNQKDKQKQRNAYAIPAKMRNSAGPMQDKRNRGFRDIIPHKCKCGAWISDDYEYCEDCEPEQGDEEVLCPECNGTGKVKLPLKDSLAQGPVDNHGNNSSEEGGEANNN